MYRIGRVKEFGALWHTRLKEYATEEKYSLRELSRLMNCDVSTIKKYKDYLQDIDQEQKNDLSGTLEQEYKERILSFIVDNKEIGRTKLRENFKKEYIYLYRKDPEWLFSNLP